MKSVTEMVSRFKQPFDADTVASQYAIKHNRNKDDVLREWDTKKKISQTCGILFESIVQSLYTKGCSHDVIREILEDQYYDREHDPYHMNDSASYETVFPLIQSFKDKEVHFQYPVSLEHVSPPVTILKEILHGKVDIVTIDRQKEGVHMALYELKCSVIKWENSFSAMKMPFHCIDDCNGNHYLLQLLLYVMIVVHRYSSLKSITAHVVQYDRSKVGGKKVSVLRYSFKEGSRGWYCSHYDRVAIGDIWHALQEHTKQHTPSIPVKRNAVIL